MKFYNMDSTRSVNWLKWNEHYMFTVYKIQTWNETSPFLQFTLITVSVSIVSADYWTFVLQWTKSGHSETKNGISKLQTYLYNFWSID